jgi:hypothetical protein
MSATGDYDDRVIAWVAVCGEDGKEERIRRLPASDSYGIRPTKALKRRSAVERVAGGAIGYQS